MTQTAATVSRPAETTQWTCKVRDDKLPDLHYVEHPESKLDLLPGDCLDVAVRILARQRTIQFIDGGAVK